MIEPFKIKVENESHSIEIQEWLFNKGVRWWPKTSSRFVEGCREICCGHESGWYLNASNGGPCFEEIDLPEKWFYDGKLQDRPKPKDKANTFRELTQAQLDGKTLQMDVLNVGWVNCTHTLDQVRVEDIDKPVRGYRVKPKSRFCNGIELDECLTEAPEDGANYYYPDPMHVDYYNLKPWANDADDIYWLELGFAYDSSESAAKHGQAMGITMEG